MNQDYCRCLKKQSLKVVLYLHNVPTINGYPENDEDCRACQMSRRPQNLLSELHLCEKSLPKYQILSGAVVNYYLLMSEEVIFVHCKICRSDFTRADFSKHHCKALQDDQVMSEP